MRILHVPIAALALGAGAVLSLAAAFAVAKGIEAAAQSRITDRLIAGELTWASVSVDGLHVTLTGAAPSDAARFRALGTVGTVVGQHRVIDAMSIEPGPKVVTPEFAIEILRNDDGVSLIGLIPFEGDRDRLVLSIVGLPGEMRVTDLLETADHPAPEGWGESVDYAIKVVALLPRSKISILGGEVRIEAVANSAVGRARLERELLAVAPDRLDPVLDLSAPRPVIAPFTLHYLIEEGQGRFESCSADSEETQGRILSAARAAASLRGGDCAIGLGQPSPRWAEAVELAIAALGKIGDGSVMFSGTAVTLAAARGVERDLFVRVAEELETGLPKDFSFRAALPESAEPGDSPGGGSPEFTAVLGPDGPVRLHGRLPDEMTRKAVQSYMHGRFGADNVRSEMLLDRHLPSGWPMRVMAALEAMSLLESGRAVVRTESVEIRGSAAPGTRMQISRILSERLGDEGSFRIDVRQAERPAPTVALPPPGECVAAINAILSVDKIAFAPGSADIPPEAGRALDRLAAKVRECEHVKMEIGGHTDSQGREEMNLNLSQARANAVLNALLARRVLTENLTARGYGEINPIADNETEAGRERNRRIAFRVLPAAEGAANDGTNEDRATEAGNEPN